MCFFSGDETQLTFLLPFLACAFARGAQILLAGMLLPVPSTSFCFSPAASWTFPADAGT